MLVIHRNRHLAAALPVVATAATVGIAPVARAPIRRDRPAGPSPPARPRPQGFSRYPVRSIQRAAATMAADVTRQPPAPSQGELSDTPIMP